MNDTAPDIPEWQQLQQHLAQVIALARKQDQFPAGIRVQAPGEASCVKALDRYPLEQWLRTGPDEVEQSVYEWSDNRDWASHWSVYFITPPGEGLEKFIARKKEQERGQERERQAKLIEEINR